MISFFSAQFHRQIIVENVDYNQSNGKKAKKDEPLYISKFLNNNIVPKRYNFIVFWRFFKECKTYITDE